MILHRKEANVGLGITFFVVGAVLLLQELHVLPKETWHYFFPLVLLAWGLALMMDWEEQDAVAKKPERKKKSKKN